MRTIKTDRLSLLYLSEDVIRLIANFFVKDPEEKASDTQSLKPSQSISTVISFLNLVSKEFSLLLGLKETRDNMLLTSILRFSPTWFYHDDGTDHFYMKDYTTPELNQIKRKFHHRKLLLNNTNNSISKNLSDETLKIMQKKIDDINLAIWWMIRAIDKPVGGDTDKIVLIFYTQGLVSIVAVLTICMLAAELVLALGWGPVGALLLLPIILPIATYWTVIAVEKHLQKNDYKGALEDWRQAMDSTLGHLYNASLVPLWLGAEDKVQGLPSNTLIIQMKDGKIEFYHKSLSITPVIPGTITPITPGETLQDYCDSLKNNLTETYNDPFIRERILQLIHTDETIKKQILPIDNAKHIIELFKNLKNSASPTIGKIQSAILTGNDKEPLKTYCTICDIIRNRSTVLSFFSKEEAVELQQLYKLVDDNNFNVYNTLDQSSVINILKKISDIKPEAVIAKQASLNI